MDNKHKQFLINPKDRGEQIEGVVRLVLGNDLYYDSLKHLPNRLNACAIKIFMSYHAWDAYFPSVIRAALRELDNHGKIDLSGYIYEGNDLQLNPQD